MKKLLTAILFIILFPALLLGQSIPQTPNLKLYLPPQGNQSAWLYYNYNWAILDTAPALGVVTPDQYKLASDPDDTLSFTRAIAALPNGGTIQLLPRWYATTGNFNNGAKPIWIRGAGWDTVVDTVFGSTQWTTQANTIGSVIQVTGPNDGFSVSNGTGYAGWLKLTDFALIGPGTGTSCGINLGTNSSGAANEFRSNNLGIFNFYKGLWFNSSINGRTDSTYIFGCTIGMDHTTTTNCRHFNVDIENCTTGIKNPGSLFRIVGGLLQNNTTCILLQPGASGLSNVYIESVWFENDTTAIIFNTTSGAISKISLIDCRNVAGNFTFTMVNAIDGIRIEGGDWSGADIALTAGMHNWFIASTDIKSYSNSGAYGVVMRAVRNAAISYASINLDGTYYYTPLGSISGTVTPDMSNGIFQSYVLTGDTTLNSPSNAAVGDEIEFLIRQDGNGAHALAFGFTAAGTANPVTATGNAASTYWSARFRCLSTATTGVWAIMGNANPWHL